MREWGSILSPRRQLEGSQPYSLGRVIAKLVVAQVMRVSSLLRRAVRERVSAILPEGIPKPCVGVHIRLGDKVGECQRGGARANASCEFVKHLYEYVPKAHSFLQQLERDTDASPPGSIFIMTDNNTIIPELKERHPDLRIFGDAGETPSLGSWADGVSNLVVLLASLEIVSHCDAFVGNVISEVSELAILYTCVKRGYCPPAFSFGIPVGKTGILSNVIPLTSAA